MTTQDVEARVLDVVEDVVYLEVDATDTLDALGVDELDLTEIIGDLESAFKIAISDEEAERFERTETTVQDLIEFMVKKLK